MFRFVPAVFACLIGVSPALGAKKTCVFPHGAADQFQSALDSGKCSPGDAVLMSFDAASAIGPARFAARFCALDHQVVQTETDAGAQIVCILAPRTEILIRPLAE